MSKQIKPQQKAESEQNQVSKQVHTETKPLQTAVSDPYIPALQRAYANPDTITPNDAHVLQHTRRR